MATENNICGFSCRITTDWSRHWLLRFCFGDSWQPPAEFDTIDVTVPLDPDWHQALPDFCQELHSLLPYRHRLTLVGSGLSANLALQAAPLLPANFVSAIALQGVSINQRSSGFCTNGVLNGATLRNWVELCRPDPSDALCTSCWNWRKEISPISVDPKLERHLLSILNNEASWGQQWYSPNLRHFPDVPLLLCGSWRDANIAGLFALLQKLSTRLASQIDLILEDKPFDQQLSYWLNSDHDTQLCYRLYRMQLSELPESTDVTYLNCYDWPKARKLRFALRAGQLAQTHESSHPSTKVFWDPKNCPHSQVWDFRQRPAVDDAGLPTAFRSDTMVFQAQPITKTLCLLGTPKLKMWCSASKSDAAFVVRLVAAPAGAPDVGTVISTGVCRLAYRDGSSVPLLYDSNDGPALLECQLSPLFCEIAAGYRLRLEITGGASPLFLLPPSASRPCHLELFHSPRYPSQLTLPEFVN